MSGITLKIDKGQSSTFSEIMRLLQSFPGLKECKKHYSVKLTEEDSITKMQRLMDALEDNDDVQNIWHNWEAPESDDED